MSTSKLLNPIVAVCVVLILAAGLLALATSRQTPVGSLKGMVVAQESGNPIDVYVSLGAPKSSEYDDAYRSTQAVNGKFQFRHVPVGEYILRVGTKWRECPPIKVRVEEGKTESLNIEVPPGKPSLEMYVHQHIFTPDEKAQVTCEGYLESDSLSVQVYRVDIDAFLARYGGDLHQLVGLRSYSGDSSERNKINLSSNANLKLSESFTSRIAKRTAEGTFLKRIDLPKLGPGMYVVAVRGDDAQQIDWMAVTSMGLVTKNANRGVLAFAVNLKSGTPIPSADVTVYDEGQVIASGKTGDDGVASLTVPEKDLRGEKTVVARSGESFAFVSSYMYGSEGSKLLVYGYTDRPVYRPGQQVEFKGIVRSVAGDKYAVPAGKQVTVEVRGPRNTLVYRAVKTTDRFGSIHGQLDLNTETPTGYYSIITKTAGVELSDEDDEGEGESAAGFRVAAYSKPEFTVKVKFDKKRYIRGDQITAKVAASYYFGAPVANAKISYTIRRAAYWLYEDDEEGYEGYEDYGDYGEYVKDGEATTNENGEVEITFPADWPRPEKDGDWDNDQEFSIEVYASDKSQRAAEGSGSVLATRGEFGVSVTPSRYVVQPGGKVRVDIRARDYDKHPVRNQEITVTMGRDFWKDDESVFQKIQERRVKTDSDGRASVEFTVKKTGDVRIVASALDKQGNRVTGSAWVWSYSEAYEEAEGVRYDELQVVTDKKTYAPGETARVLINTRMPGATALVTVEGERIYTHKTVTLKGRSTAVDIPVLAAYRPNFYIGVCFVQKKSFHEQQARVKVSLASQSVNVRIEPNKSRYLPGERALYRLKTTDAQGKPVSAQVSLGVVDEAIYAIQPDDTTPILDYFYSRKPNNVSTSFSFPEIYLSDPEKAGGALAKMPHQKEMRLRKRFLDTAFWQPDVVTGPNGEATVRFQMPDNLTTWRATARAITTDTRCGESTGTVFAQQDMLVRLGTPRFLVQGDTTTLSAIVHNYTGSRDSVDVKLSVPGLKVDGSRNQSVRVADSGSERVDWTISAPKPGEFTVTVTAKGSRAGDAMQLTLPVHPHGEERQETKTGAVGGSQVTSFHLNLRRDSIPEATKLKIRLAPSLASAMLGSLDYLAQYPYGCTEQTTSSFLPDVILFRTFKELGIVNPRLEAKLPDMVQTGLLRLYRFQIEDGGWGWCEYGKADPWMTAYVCYGLIQAKRAGFAVNQGVLDEGLNALSHAVSMSVISALQTAMAEGRERVGLDPDTTAYCLYVLALSGQDLGNRLDALAQIRNLPPRSLASLSLAYTEVGRMNEARTALDRLFGKAVIEPAFIHWKSDWDYGGGSVETTALGLEALLRVSSNDERAYRIVRWLMDRREGGDYWFSTRDTAMTLYAMAEYLKSSRELAPDYTAQVLVNGKSLGTYRFGKSSLFDPDREVVIPASSLKKGRNTVEIVKNGPGNLYYSAKLTQYVAKKYLPAIVTGAGVSIKRAYYKPGTRFWEEGNLSALGSQVDSCSTGDTIMVRLTVYSTKRLQHLLLEDYIPAGFEIVDKGHVDYWDWDYWYVQRDIRDDKISFYLDRLRPAKYVADYQMRAVVPGSYHAMPAQVFGMYDPSIRASTAEAEFEVR